MGIFFNYIDDFERLFREENKNATENTNNSTEIENNFKYCDDNMTVPERLRQELCVNGESIPVFKLKH